MPVLAAPAFLLAGALAALVPLALHLIRRRPPVRAPLPTARFLSHDPRRAVRVSRPTDLPLLLLRMAMLLLLGLGLASPAWMPRAEGTSTVVLLDRAGPPEAWRAGLAAARSSLVGADGTARGALVVFDTAAEVRAGAALTPAAFDSLAALPPAPRSELAAGFRAIRPAVRSLPGADSVRVRLASAFSGGGWTDGTGGTRTAAWPGAIELVRLPSPPVGTDSAPPADPRRAVVVARQGGGFAAAALAALGFEVSRAASLEAAGAADVYVLADLEPVDELRVDALARGGSTVVVPSAGVGGESAGEMWFGRDLRIDGAGARTVLEPSPDLVVLASWEDGRPAATARPVGDGCVVEAGTALEGGELPYRAAYPAALGRLARGCETAPTPERPLDAGALAVLRGGGPAEVQAAALVPESRGIPLGRWILAAALLAALAETALAYRRRGA